MTYSRTNDLQLPEAFLECALLRGLGVFSLYGARGEALWQEMVLGHSKG